ncbi:3-dehydroquinate synthase [Thermoflavimicrobium dichotomicum]|uniref:3-dehydroquinate synthase n=1 Tax=Thermoflavimicrobium dichotomicum TaxID=46223 RepID=A0A1I3U1Q4_9BACL|nr:3-dehydroquinate synthase [Thermoflavimicrobium dichotomicum]SFJ77474.1 3-dehydroquinate synthase [Thermoflavimicrobium dichotomicum]
MRKLNLLEELTICSRKKIYKIFFGENILNNLREILEDNSLLRKKILLITDDNVKQYYLDQVSSQFINSDILFLHYSIKPGGKNKSLDNAMKIYQILIKHSFYKDDLIIALGGGVIGDLAGFVAASYYRGIKFVQIPTTLLSQVDSSIGGKVAVHFQKITNAIGFFYPPDLCLIDPSLLKTLPKREFNNGMAEIIKAAFVQDPDLFLALESMNLKQFDSKTFNYIILQSVKLKKKLVEIDEMEKGPRLCLNFGHTLAHALESLTNHSLLLHGEAVSIGCVFECFISEYKHGFFKENTNRLIRVLKKYNLPTVIDTELYSAKTLDDLTESIIRFMKFDKKVSQGRIRFILPLNVGSFVIEEVEDISLIKKLLYKMYI